MRINKGVGEMPENKVESAEGWEQLVSGEEVENETSAEESEGPQKTKEGGWQKVLKVAVGLFIVVVLVGAGILTGAVLQKNGTSSSENQETGQLLDGSGGGKLVGDVVPISPNDKLTLELLKLHNVRENSCYSPLSIRYALEMLSEGAEGETKKQIDNLLGGIKATKYENVADRLSVANSLWMKGGIKESYQNTLKNEYGAEVRQDDFRTAANINNWVENKSFGMLKDVLDDSDVQDLQAALVNVLAIDMEWQNTYDYWATSGQYFDFNWDKGEDNIRYTTMWRWGGEDVYYNLAAEATVFAQDLKEYNGTRL